MAKQVPNKNKKRKAQVQRKRGTNASLIIVAAVGIVAVLAGYLLQVSPIADQGTAHAAVRDVRISEVMASNASTLATESGDFPDWIEIENTGNTAVDLTGCTLMSASKLAQAFVFPACTIQAREYMLIYADGSTQTSKDGQLHAPFKIPASGEKIALLDRSGNSIDVVETLELKRDQSYCRDAAGDWQVSDAPTPGEVNRIESTEAQAVFAASEIAVHAGKLEISEVMNDSVTYFRDENGEYHDYIELHNLTDQSISLKDWYLSDKKEDLLRWQFPEVSIPAGGYLAVHCSGYDRKDDPAHLHTNFKLSQDGDMAILTNPNGVTLSMVSLPLLVADQAYSRIASSWSKTASPTPGAANTLESAAAMGDDIRTASGTGVYITEIVAASSSSYDWVEIYNATQQAIDLSGYGLSDNAARPRKWQFPSGTTLQPGKYTGIFMSGLDSSSGQFPHANFKLSVDGGYSVTLSDGNGVIQDRVFLPQQYQDISYGRAEGQSGFRYFTKVTPSAANAGQSYMGRVSVPNYSVNGGLFTTGEAQSVELTAQAGARIHYTLDNTDPDEGDTLYTGPISVSQTTILRTKVYCEGYLDSYMDTQSYLYDVNNADGNVYVVSLVSDPYNLTSDEAGIMIKGPNALPNPPYGSMNKGANFWMDWEREAHVEVFNGDGSAMISQECGIKLHGQYSRKENQQAFKVIARSEYGSNRFDASIFSNRDYTEYQSFLLRSSGQDTDKTRMRDSTLSALAENTSVLYQETELCVVYLDGVYWGHYNIRERINAESICQFEGWEGDEDKIDLIKANSNVMQGSNDTFAKLVAWVKANKTNTDEAYNAIASMIDMQNYIEYMAIQMYTGNTDTLNVKRYRNANADGKWRWVLFDLDWAFHEDTNSVRRWLASGGMGNGLRTDNTLFIACMKNATFRDQFLAYLGQKMATDFSAESMLARFQERYDALKPIMSDQMERWSQTESTQQSELKKLINYAKNRPSRMLQFLKYAEALNLTEQQMTHYFGDAMAQVGVTYSQIKKPD